jgi:hypothetical protein
LFVVAQGRVIDLDGAHVAHRDLSAFTGSGSQKPPAVELNIGEEVAGDT